MFWMLKHIYWKVCSETSQLYMQHWDSVLSDIWELFQWWDENSLCYVIFDERIIRCIILTLEDDFSQNYFIRLLYKLSSQSHQRLSEPPTT